MLQIRLLRIGKKHHPYFRLVLVNKGKRPGKYLENLGFYSPTDKKNKVQKVETERIQYWISKGAQATPTVHNILVGAKVIDKAKIKIKIAKPKKEEKKPEAVPKPAAAAEVKPAEAVVSNDSPQVTKAPAETKPVHSTDSGQAA